MWNCDFLYFEQRKKINQNWDNDTFPVSKECVCHLGVTSLGQICGEQDQKISKIALSKKCVFTYQVETASHLASVISLL